MQTPVAATTLTDSINFISGGKIIVSTASLSLTRSLSLFSLVMMVAVVGLVRLAAFWFEAKVQKIVV